MSSGATFTGEVVEMLACPRCRGVFAHSGDEAIACGQCCLSYPIDEGRIFFTVSPKDAPRSHSGPDSRQWSTWRQANFAYLQRQLAHEAREEILVDLGAGASQFRSLTGDFRLSIGVDFFPYERVLIVADLDQRVPFRDECCDVVFLSNVLDHVPHPQELLNECFRILRRGGRIVGTVAFLLHVNQAPYDFFRYTHFMLRRMLSLSGFSESEVQPVGRPVDVYETMQRRFFHLLLALPGRSLPLRITARGLWALQRAVFAIFRPLYRRAHPSSFYTEGYGFSAVKTKYKFHL